MIYDFFTRPTNSHALAFPLFPVGFRGLIATRAYQHHFANRHGGGLFYPARLLLGEATLGSPAIMLGYQIRPFHYYLALGG